MATAKPVRTIDTGLQKLIGNKIADDVEDKVFGGVNQALQDVRDGVIRNEDDTIKENVGFLEGIMAWLKSIILPILEGMGDFGRGIADMFDAHIPKQHEVKELSQQVTKSVSEALATKDVASGQLVAMQMTPEQLEAMLNKKIAKDITENPLLADAFSAEDIAKTAKKAAKDAVKESANLLPEMQAIVDAGALMAPSVAPVAPGQTQVAAAPGVAATISATPSNAAVSPEFATTLTTMATTFMLTEDKTKTPESPDVVENGKLFVKVAARVVRENRSKLESKDPKDRKAFSDALVLAVITDQTKGNDGQTMGDNLRREARERELELFAGQPDELVNQTLIARLKTSLDAQLKNPELVETLLAQTRETAHAPAASLQGAAPAAVVKTTDVPAPPPSAELLAINRGIAELAYTTEQTNWETILKNKTANTIKADAIDKTIAGANAANATKEGVLSFMDIVPGFGTGSRALLAVADSNVAFINNLHPPTDAMTIVNKHLASKAGDPKYSLGADEKLPEDVDTARKQIYEWAVQKEYAPNKEQRLRIGEEVAKSIMGELGRDVKTDPKDKTPEQQQLATRLKKAVQTGLENAEEAISGLGKASVAKLNSNAGMDLFATISGRLGETLSDPMDAAGHYGFISGIKSGLDDKKEAVSTAIQAEKDGAANALKAQIASAAGAAKNMTTNGQETQGPDGGKPLANFTTQEVSTNQVGGK